MWSVSVPDSEKRKQKQQNEEGRKERKKERANEQTSPATAMWTPDRTSSRCQKAGSLRSSSNPHTERTELRKMNPEENRLLYTRKGTPPSPEPS